MKVLPSLLLVIASCCLERAFGADVRLLGVAKMEDYVQAEPGAPAPAEADAHSFYAWVDLAASNSVQAATLQVPTGDRGSLTQSTEPLTLDFVDYYDNPFLMDLVYPPGPYRFDIFGRSDGVQTVILDLPENFYPNVARILNWADAQKIRADLPFQFSWEPITEGTSFDFIQLIIYDWNDEEVFSTPDVHSGLALNGATTSYTLPANVLQPGTDYYALLLFARVVDRDTASYPGVPALGAFIRRTFLPLRTAGTVDIDKVQFSLSFSYFSWAGDLYTNTTVMPTFPVALEDCYVGRLLVRNEEFVPPVSGVVFNSPPGTLLTNSEAAFRYLQEQSDAVVYETECLSAPDVALPGLWTIGYNDYPLIFNVPDAKTAERFVVPVPTAVVEGNQLRRLEWRYYQNDGQPLSQAPLFITNQVVELLTGGNLLLYSSDYFGSHVSSVGFSRPIDWHAVRIITIAYQDNLGNWYGINFDHSPRGDLEIINNGLPHGSLQTPYEAALTLTNGTGPFTWSLDGDLPPGLSLNPETGVISGVPLERGYFVFGVRVDDQTDAFDYEQFNITITTNGPPVILEQPEGGDAVAGDFTWFELLAEGTQPLAYQWFFNDQPLLGETNEILYLVDITSENAGIYRVRVSNALGSVMSDAAPLRVLQPPIIVRQPASQTVQPGTNVTFTVEVRASPPLFYQWQRNGYFIEGATNASYTIPNAQPQDAGSYQVLIANFEGLVESEPAILEFSIQALALTNRFTNRVEITATSGLGTGSNGGSNRDPGEPLHVQMPGGSSVWITWVPPVSGVATFTTAGSSFDTLLAVYTGTEIDQLTEVASDDDGGDFFTSSVSFNVQAGRAYHIAIDGVYGDQGQIILGWNTEANVSLPEILQQPVDAIVPAGGTAVFSLQATNPPPSTASLSYQWYFNGLEISGATNNSLSIPNVGEDDLGLYFAIVANEAEFVFSDLVVIEISSDFDAIDRRVSTEDKFANVPRQTNGLPPLVLGAGRIQAFAGGSVARGYSGSQVFSTVNSTTEAGEPNHCGIVGGASQWFSYLAITNGFLSIDTDGSDFDTVLTVYTGSEVDFASLTEIACDNDGGLDGVDSRVTFPAVAVTLYLVAVDGVRGAKGTARLNYNLSQPPELAAVERGGVLDLMVTGQPRGLFKIEVTSDLRTWTAMTTNNTSAAGQFTWQDTRPQREPTQFYRCVQIQ